MENTEKLTELGLTFEDFRVMTTGIHGFGYVSEARVRKHLEAAAIAEGKEAGLANEAFLDEAANTLANTAPVTAVVPVLQSQDSEQFDASQKSEPDDEAYVEGAKGKSAYELDPKELTELIADKDAMKDVSHSHP